MSKVIIKQCGSYDMAELTDRLNEGMEGLGGWEAFVRPGMKVLLKVNLIGPKASDTAAVTHCEFVRAVTRILKSKGCIVWIGDSSGGAIAGIAPTTQSFVVSGLDRVAREEGAEIKNFDKEGIVEAEASVSGKMYLAKPLFDADMIINLPKLKTHTSGMYTGAVKNSFGCIPGLKKAQYHKQAPNPLDFGDIIADINEILKIKLHIMDGVTAMQGEGPTAGEPYQAGKILLATDPLALDTVASGMIGMDIEDIPILHKARERKLGEAVLRNIELAGDFAELPMLSDFKLPKNFKSTKKQNYKALGKVIDFLRARPRINTRICKGCNMCVESCPMEAIDKATKRIDYSRCIECMCCHELCMHKAVELRKDNAVAGMMMKLYRGSYK